MNPEELSRWNEYTLKMPDERELNEQIEEEFNNKTYEIIRHEIDFIERVLEDQIGFHSGDCFCKDMFVCVPIPEDREHRCPVCRLDEAISRLKEVKMREIIEPEGTGYEEY